MVGHRRMDRKLKTLLKGAGLGHLVGGETNDERQQRQSDENKKKMDAFKALTPEQRIAQVKGEEAQRAARQAADNIAARKSSEKGAADAAAKPLRDLSESLSSGNYNPKPDNYKLLGELVFYKGHEDPKGGYPYWKNDSTTEGTDGPPPYLAKSPATIADYQFWYDHISSSLREFITKFWSMNRTVLVDRHQNETPEEFEKTKADMLKQLDNPMKTGPYGKPVSKTPNEILRDQWITFHLKQLSFWKRAEEYVAKDPIYRNVMGQEQWAAVFKNNAAEWQERVNDAVNPQVKASLISEFGEYQRLNASYETYVANENAKPPPPSYQGKDISEVTKGVAEEDVKFDKREQIKKIRDADLETEREVAQKTATLNGMKTGNPINDQEIDEALAYIKWGEELREQISLWELAGANKDMTLQDYWSSIGEPDLIDVEVEVAKEKEQIQNRINDYKKSPQYVLDQIKKWGMLVIDIGVNFLPYILPFPIGNVIQLGYEAFAPVGSIYHTEGSFTQKLQAGLVNGAEQAVLGMIGLGRKGRRKYMKTLMESEGGGEMGQAPQIEDDSRSRHALHAKTPAGSQRRRKGRSQT